jgi:hypothetical protein
MGEWKAQISLPVRQGLRREMKRSLIRNAANLGTSEKCCIQNRACCFPFTLDARPSCSRSQALRPIPPP